MLALRAGLPIASVGPLHMAGKSRAAPGSQPLLGGQYLGFWMWEKAVAGRMLVNMICV